jgi:ElaB/YqjD/DUF883 family membrane-anchored ribosome-binding protein
MENESIAEPEVRQAAAAEEESLEGQIETLKAELASVRATLAEILKSGVRKGRAKAEHVAEDYLKQGQEHAEAAKESVSAFSEVLEEQITKNPLTAMLLALGLGYFFGVIGRR